ncbi:enterobactin exporter EntS [Aquimixticola soesokkakensis]|uniref:Enterobactin exporter EntS n=1 Tax=Aquimixticola soesokkakensis TaxID=1519096 RepID=A0A1Y5RR41_9RHOB|nr:MFS transporter [Aquimixticola soesokkakensis]SLN22979.1 enterobactin exporter EntS [Aquimixticola soesokkakensis]
MPKTPPSIFAQNGYGNFLGALLFNGISVQILTVSVGWQLYDLTRDPLDLGLVGLSQFAPALLLFLVTGSVADRFPRRLIMSICLALMGMVSGAFLLFTALGRITPPLVFGLIVVFGVARAFYNPTRQSLATNVVSAANLPRALALNSSAFKIATICGPVLGGLLFGVSAELAYGTGFACALVASLLILLVPAPAQRSAIAKQSWSEITAGLQFIRRQPIILGAISLDLFVGLLGGAFALLPVYARDILDVGALGLGLLRAAPAVGAITIGFCLMIMPIRRNAGRLMFLTVALFALATLVFALSKTVWISVVALVVVGGSDMISVVIRSTLVQLNTPDELRGRVNAVNVVFIGASNELGAFRAGTMAAVFGPVVAVAGGALAALGVCGLWWRYFPALRRANDLSGH